MITHHSLRAKTRRTQPSVTTHCILTNQTTQPLLHYARAFSKSHTSTWSRPPSPHPRAPYLYPYLPFTAAVVRGISSPSEKRLPVTHHDNAHQTPGSHDNHSPTRCAVPPTSSTHDSTTDSHASPLTAIIAASSGNLVEWFDFYTYAFFSVYFAEQFFTGTGETGAWVKSAAVFFVGFLMRPLGGYLFGRLADKRGRKHSMMVAIVMMCTASFLFAILPTAATVGAAAPWLLLAVRCVQGISVGGEYGSTATYMSEIAPPGRRGFYSSFHYVTLIGGQLLASLLAVTLTHILGDDAIINGWWRLPFAIGGAGAIVSLLLRSTLEETTRNDDRARTTSGSLTAVITYPRSFWVVFGLTCIGSLAFYTFSTYMHKHLISTSGFTKGEASDIMTVCLFLFMLMQPAVGALSDKIGRKNSMLIFGVGMVILPVPGFTLLAHVDNPLVAGIVITIAMVVLSFYTAISGIVKAEMFPMHLRALGVGFTYAIANSLFGGSAEFVALGLKNAGHPTWFPLYMTIIAALGLIAISLMKDNRTHSTLDHQDELPEHPGHATRPRPKDSDNDNR